VLITTVRPSGSFGIHNATFHGRSNSSFPPSWNRAHQPGPAVRRPRLPTTKTGVRSTFTVLLRFRRTPPFPVPGWSGKSKTSDSIVIVRDGCRLRVTVLLARPDDDLHRPTTDGCETDVFGLTGCESGSRRTLSFHKTSRQLITCVTSNQ